MQRYGQTPTQDDGGGDHRNPGKNTGDKGGLGMDKYADWLKTKSIPEEISIVELEVLGN